MAGGTSHNEGIRILEEFVCQAVPAAVPLEVEIDWPGVSPQSAADEVGGALPEEHRHQVALAVRPARPMPGVRAMAPAVVGVTIQGGATVVAAFIAAWLTWPNLPKPTGASVILTTPDGTTLELPIQASPEQIKQVAAAVASAKRVRLKIRK